MSFFRRFRRPSLADLAREDALLGVDAGEDRVVAVHGPRPAFDPVGNHVHARLAADLQGAGEIEELQSDLREQENLRVDHASVSGSVLLLAGAYLLEAVACILALRALGVTNPERTPFALGLAAFLFIMGATVVRKRRWWAVLAYGGVAVALTIVRIGEFQASDEGSPAKAVAGGLLLLAVSIGPALAAEPLARRLTPALRIAREIRKTRARIRTKERALQQARREVERIARAGAEWGRLRERTLSIYRTEQRRALASLGRRSPHKPPTIEHADRPKGRRGGRNE